MKIRYTSYEEVDKELEILRLEREISIRKIGNNAEEITSLFSPGQLLQQGLTSLGSSVKNSKGIKTLVLSTVLKFLFNKFIKKKQTPTLKVGVCFLITLQLYVVKENRSAVEDFSLLYNHLLLFWCFSLLRQPGYLR